MQALRDQIDNLRQDNIGVKNKLYDSERTIKYLEEKLEEQRKTPF